MARFLVTVLLAVCVSYASAAATWGDEWQLWKPCDCANNYGYPQSEVWRKPCYGDGCPIGYETQERPCNCRIPPALSPGEIAGIVVGALVFLILIIIIIIWCFYCGCDCDSGHGLRRYHSDDSISVYRGKVIPAQPLPVVAAPYQQGALVPQIQQAPVTYAVAPAKPVSFCPSVIQQAPVFQQQGAIYAKSGPAITVLQ